MELRVLASIWGSAFADVFLRWSLPSLLSHGNCRRVLVGGHHMTFYIYSDATTLEYLRSSEVTTSSDGKEFNFFPMSETLFDGNPLDYEVESPSGGINTHELQSRCYMHGMEQLGEGEVVFLFWTADFALSDGGLDWAMRQIDNGQKAVYADYVEIRQESAADELDPYYTTLGGGPSGRELAQIGLRHTHQITLDHFCDDGLVSSYPPFLFLLSEDSSFVHTGIFPHPLLVCFDNHTTRFESSVDYEFAQRVVGEGSYAKAVDSDDLLLCAITRGDGYGQLERNELTADLLAHFLISEANQIHFDLARRIGIIHTSGISVEGEAKRNQMSRFLQQVYDKLILIGNDLDLTDVKNLIAVKSFFGPCALYASPQRQNINRRWIGDIKD
ncbi:MAG TPA: hypothetical protein EYQ26_14370 [Rhodospirillales bacterium]|nr:hypothetical protein [Rhodospirillales bacterium]